MVPFSNHLFTHKLKHVQGLDQRKHCMTFLAVLNLAVCEGHDINHLNEWCSAANPFLGYIYLSICCIFHLESFTTNILLVDLIVCEI